MRTGNVIFGLVALAMAAPAFAGVSCTPATPGPIAGAGIGAVAVLGIGYRALRRRIGR